MLADAGSGDALRCDARQWRCWCPNNARGRVLPRYAVVPWSVAARSDVPLSLADWPCASRARLTTRGFPTLPSRRPLDTTAPALRAAAVPPNVYIQYLQSALCGATPLLASRCLPRPIDPRPRSAQPPILEGLNLERLHDRVYLVAQPAPTPCNCVGLTCNGVSEVAMSSGLPSPM